MVGGRRARLQPARLAKNALTARSAQPLKSLPRTEWPVNGTTTSCAPGISAATRRALAVGVLISCAPDRISVGTFGRRRGGGRRRGTRPARRRSRGPGCCRARCFVERVERRARLGAQEGAASAEPRRGRCRALPRERASPRRSSSRTALRRSRRSFLRPAGLTGTVGMSPSESRCRRSSGSGSLRSADCTAAGSSARSAGFRSPASRMSSRPTLVERAEWRRARAVVDGASERVLAQLRRQPREIGDGVRGDPAAGVPGAEFVEHAGRPPAARGCANGSGPSVGTTESSTSASTCWG